MLKGFRGKLLTVNLTTKKISIEPLIEEIGLNFLGGSGYACRYLYDKLSKETDPLSPENIIMIMKNDYSLLALTLVDLEGG